MLIWYTNTCSSDTFTFFFSDTSFCSHLLAQSVRLHHDGSTSEAPFVLESMCMSSLRPAAL